MFLVKNKDFTYSPVDDSDKNESNKIAVGTVVKATAPRNWKLHKKIFVLFKLAFDNQDKILSAEVHRKILILRAGYYDEVENKHGNPYFIPQSLSFDSMPAETFNKVFTDVLNIVAKDLDTAPEKIRAEVESFYS